MSSLKEKLVAIQTEMKAPKNLYNSYGGYKYRNAEGILEAAKPYLKQHNVVLLVYDDIVAVGERIYVKAIAEFRDVESDEFIRTQAFAREALTKKGMDDSQITGTASSYARKYALNGLFLLDDTKDADTDENHRESEARHRKTSPKAKDEPTDKEQQAMQDLANMKISKIKVDSLAQRCVADGVPTAEILRYYNIKSLEDMTEGNYAHMAQNWSKLFKK